MRPWSWAAWRLLPERRRLEAFPAFRAMRVRVTTLEDDWRRVRLSLPLAHNRNPGGSMFGGAIACLADPVAALACARRFPAFQVWTRSLHLDFVHEGRTDLELRFDFDPRLEDEIAQELEHRRRATPTFRYALYDASGALCVDVTCRVAIRPRGYRSARHSNKGET